MDKHKMSDDAAAPSGDQQRSTALQATQPIPAPASDPTNPHNQELAGDWVANERAAERRNFEPGLTDEERKHRRW